MRKTLMLLIVCLLIVVAAHAQPLVSTSSLKVTFTPVLVQETVEEGHEDGNVIYGPTITFRRAYRVKTD